MTWILVLFVTIDGSYGKAVAVEQIPMLTRTACLIAGGTAVADFKKAEQPGKISFSCFKIQE